MEYDTPEKGCNLTLYWVSRYPQIKYYYSDGAEESFHRPVIPLAKLPVCYVDAYPYHQIRTCQLQYQHAWATAIIAYLGCGGGGGCCRLGGKISSAGSEISA